MDSTLVFKADKILLEPGTQSRYVCPYDFVNFIGGPRQEILRSICGRILSRTTVAMPAASLHVLFKTDETLSDEGFNLTYSYSNCGGVVSSPRVIESPSSLISQDYPPDTSCAWMVEFEDSQQIEVVDRANNAVHFITRILCFIRLRSTDFLWRTLLIVPKMP